MIKIYHERILVEPSSIDVLGHVNNREYLRWMERLATQHVEQCNWGYEPLKTRGFVWVAHQHWIEYLKPTLVGQTLDLYTWIQSFKGVSSLRRYAMKRADELVLVGATHWVFVDYASRRPASILDEMKTSFITVTPEDAELIALGIDRPVRYMPQKGL